MERTSDSYTGRERERERRMRGEAGNHKRNVKPVHGVREEVNEQRDNCVCVCERERERQGEIKGLSFSESSVVKEEE